MIQRRLIDRTVQKLAHRQQDEQHAQSHSYHPSPAAQPHGPPAIASEAPAQDAYLNSASSTDEGAAQKLTPVPAITLDPSSKSTSQSPSPHQVALLLPSETATLHDSSRSIGQSKRPDHSRDTSPDDGIDEGRYLRSRLWWFGMVLIAIGESGNFLSYGFAPASVVAPLGTVVCLPSTSRRS